MLNIAYGYNLTAVLENTFLFTKTIFLYIDFSSKVAPSKINGKNKMCSSIEQNGENTGNWNTNITSTHTHLVTKTLSCVSEFILTLL